MTTGRINQVAFLADAGAARGRRARGPRRLPPETATAVVRCGRFTPGSGRRRHAVRLLPSWCSASESSGGIPWPGTQGCDRDTRSPSGFVSHRTDFARGAAGRLRENVGLCDGRIPSCRYAAQETRGRPRLCACADD